MNPEKTRYSLFSRRAALLAGGQMLLLGGLASRMYYLQVVEGEKYQTLAEDNRISLRLLAPTRGMIVDRNGNFLAINIENYRVIVVPEQAGDLHATLERLARVIKLDDSDVARVEREAGRRRRFVPITVHDNLTWEEVSRIGVNTPDLPGVNIDVGLTRHYPYAVEMAHIVGYVSAVSERDLTGDPVLELPGFRIGKNGVERTFDEALRGKAGTSQVEVNAVGRVIKELSRQEGVQGETVRLTIDMRLQEFAARRVWDEKSCSIVVMDCHTGAVHALVSKPSYDPNAFAEGLDQATWKALLDNPYAPLTNKAIAGQYAPGSTFKIAVLAAALEEGLSLNHSVFCPGHLEFGNRRFHCWKRPGHGHMDTMDAFRQSCDVWYYEVARRLGIDTIAAYSRRLGLGSPLGIELVGERGGLMPDRAWKRGALGEPWHPGETLVAGIGQGYITTTPLQLAVMTARVVNGGKAVVPHLADSLLSPEGLERRLQQDFPDIGFKPRTLEVLRNALDETVNTDRGTAYGSRITDPEMAMGGKTGTAQVRRITKAERDTGVRDNSELPWHLRDHGLFVAAAPIRNPRFVCAVVVDHGGSGSRAAAPVARDVLLKTQELFSPSLTKAPQDRRAG
jgi:penicillin-binding protein 2